MSQHTHPYDVCFLWNVPCEARYHPDVDPPRVCERCAAHRATFEADALFLALRELNNRLEWYEHREGCPRGEHVECGMHNEVYDCNEGLDESACKTVECYECDRDKNAAGVRRAFDLRIAELIGGGT